MYYEDAILKIESEWEPENGFFWRLRQGLFAEEDFDRVLAKVSSVSIPSDDTLIPKRLVSLIWYIPLFMTWQQERVELAGSDAESYSKAITEMTNEVTRVLGFP